MSGLTKEERYLLKLYVAVQKMENLDHRINRYEVGTLAGLSERAVNAVCKFLIRANFIKKGSEEDIYITTQGIELAEKLYGSH